MKHLKNIWWFLGFALAYAFVLLSAETVLNWIMPVIGISPNRSTAGAYTLEMLVLFACGIALIARVVTAVSTTHTVERAFKVLISKTALASLAVVGLVAVQIQNRGQWWIKHMFTDEAYNHVEYTATASSLLYGLFLISLIFAIYPRKPPGSPMQLSDFGSDRLAIMIFAASVWAFTVGAVVYSGRP